MDSKCFLTSTDLQTRRARCQHQLSFLFYFGQGHPACKRLGVHLLAVMIWLELARLTWVHLENGRWNRERDIYIYRYIYETSHTKKDGRLTEGNSSSLSVVVDCSNICCSGSSSFSQVSFGRLNTSSQMSPAGSGESANNIISCSTSDDTSQVRAVHCLPSFVNSVHSNICFTIVLSATIFSLHAISFQMARIVLLR